MESHGLLSDGFDRVREAVHAALDGLTAEQLAYRADDQANSIAWLVWHLTRIQDDHVADAAGTEQVWTADGWAERFALPFDDADTGYGHGPDDIGALGGADAGLLAGYHDAVHDRTIRYVGTLTDADLDRVVDRRWSPPVTLGVRLVSVISDDLQHAGQAAFVHGLIRRRPPASH